MLSAVGFLTIAGGARPPGPSTFKWFPLVGALIGSVLATGYWGAHELWPPLVAGAAVVAIDLVITGALHLDGLADSADGLLPHMKRERRLEVMADPTVGVFAVATIGTVLLIRWSVLADPDIEPVALAGVWAMSRTMAAVIPSLVPYARQSGLASPFLAGSRIWLALWLLPAGAVVVLVADWRGVAAVSAALLVTVGLVLVAKRRLGGFTGDVLGAVVVASETAALLAFGAQL